MNILSFENFPFLNDYTEGFMNPWDEDPNFPLPGEAITKEQVEWFYNFILGEISEADSWGIEKDGNLDALRQEIHDWQMKHATV